MNYDYLFCESKNFLLPVQEFFTKENVIKYSLEVFSIHFYLMS